MNIITKFIDQLTQLVFGTPVFKIIKRARETKNSCKQVDDLAKRKKLTEAIKLARKTASLWSANPSPLEKWLRNQLLGNKLTLLNKCQQEWQRQLERGREIVQSALHLIKTAEKNPCDQEALSNLDKALSLYQQAEQVVYDVTLQRKIRDLEITIKKYQVFRGKLDDAEQLAEMLYFKQAIVIINEARVLIPAAELETKIANYQASVEKENKYEEHLTKIRLLFEQNQYQAAKNLIEITLSNFNRSDGQSLLTLLNDIIKFEDKLNLAILEERQNNFNTAKKIYVSAVQQAISISQTFDKSNIYLQIVRICIQTQKYEEGLFYLTELNCDNSSYLRGFIYAKQKQWQQAGREWRKVHNPEIRGQLSVLKNLIEKDKFLMIQSIENDLKNRNHQSALEKSQLFLQQFGIDSIVEQNLDQHIKPFIRAESWSLKGNTELINISEQEWLDKPSIITLHNLTLALYEHIDQNSEADFSLFTKFIGLWFTLLANLEHNPKLRDVLWMDTRNINFDNLQKKLIKVIEDLTETRKKSKVFEAERLRDNIRLELVVLNLLQESSLSTLRFNQLTILPGCYHQYHQLFPNSYFAENILGTLYSDWGFAVAACMDNHIPRAIELKPNYSLQSPAETYGFNFVGYHEGRYHLQQFDWRKSVDILKKIQASIQSNSEWREDIDQLCSTQRRKINDFNEHLEFAQFWYDLLQSSDSRSYLAEYNAEAIREQWANDKISDDSALEKLNQLKKIDPHNPIILELCQKVKDYQEAQQFDKLIKAGDIERLVNFAKNSSNSKIRFAAAELFIKMALDGAEKQSLDFDAIRQLGKWAYEIAPHEPAFREFYRALRIPY